MSSRNLLNLFLLLLFVGLLMVAIYEPGKPEKPAAQTITNIDLATIKNLRIESPGRSATVLQKGANEWQMLQPFTMPANEGRIQQVLKLIQAKSVASYPLAQVDLQQLQLDDPILVLTIDSQILKFGTTTALDEKRYVQVGETVHLISDRYSHLARSAASEFVSPQLLASGTKITQLQITGIALEDEGFQALMKEWQLARAHKVSVLEKANGKIKSVELVVDNGAPLRFDVLRTESEIILQRPDVGLQYHFALEAGERLLALPGTDSTNAK